MARRASGQRLLLSEDAERTSGRDARDMNITAARAIAEAVRTTLGPMGMDKMLVDSDGDVVVTNDGVTILSEMDIEHPAANMIVEVAETQEDEVGDGTTTAVVLAGELLNLAEELVDQEIHPTTVASGYREATQRAEELLEELAFDVDTQDRDTLEQIAMTVMTGKSAEDDREYLAGLAVDAVQSVAQGDRIDIDDIDLEKAPGQTVDDSELVEGVILDEEPVRRHAEATPENASMNMPNTVEDANIALLHSGIELDEPEIDADIAVDDPTALQEFEDAGDEALRGDAKQILELDADVLFAGSDIAPIAASLLAEDNVIAVESMDEEDLSRVARATGGQVATTIDELSEENLGHAGEVSTQQFEDDEKIVIQGVDAAEVVTLVLRGGTEGALEEIERALNDSLHAVRVAIESGSVLPGGGAAETALSLALRDYADSVGGREQLAIESFADALEVVPRTLAENAGLDPIDSLVTLRSEHSDNDHTAGLDAVTGDVIDMWDDGVVEPLPVKRQAIGSATEAAVMILRIDDVISASGELS